MHIPQGMDGLVIPYSTLFIGMYMPGVFVEHWEGSYRNTSREGHQQDMVDL